MRIIGLITALNICSAKLSPKLIKAVLDETGIHQRLNNTVMNPFFAFLFEETGCLHNLRFYGPKIQPTIERRTGNVNEKPTRIFAKDKAENGDSVAEIAIRLFPSPAGIITSTTAAKSNFGKYFIEEIQKNPAILKAFADLFVVIAKEEKKFNCDKSLIKKLKLSFIKTDPDEYKKKNEGQDTKPFMIKTESPITLYKNYEKDLKLLLLNSFIINILDTENHLKIYLKHISENLVPISLVSQKDEKTIQNAIETIIIYNNSFFSHTLKCAILIYQCASGDTTEAKKNI